MDVSLGRGMLRTILGSMTSDLSSIKIVSGAYLLYYMTWNPEIDLGIHGGDVECHTLFYVTVTTTFFFSIFTALGHI